MSKLILTATTAFGLESVTAREIEKLGYRDKATENGKVTFAGDENAVARCNLGLRTADRILIKMGEFKAESFEELFQGVKNLPWEEFLPEDAEFPVTGKSVKSKLFSVPDCQAITKKAIVEKLKQRYGRELFEETGNKYKIEVSLLNDMATLTIDTSGAGLNKRGYRAVTGKAPIKETLASALILLSYWKNGRLLCDPLCGSGTIPIEAALIAKNISPGISRSFVSESWENFDPLIWKKAREEARSLERPVEKGLIFGSDIDRKNIELSCLHAKEAGVEDIISFRRADVRDFHSKESFGFIITNPPYGERLGDRKETELLYRDMGKIFTKLDNWSYYIITAYRSFEKLFGKKADKRRKLYNGRLECQYYQYLSKEKPPKNIK